FIFAMSCLTMNMIKVIGRKVRMNAMIKHAVDNWRYVAPLLSKPVNEDDFHTLTEALDELLDIVSADESHPLMELIHQLSDMVSAYEHEHLPMPEGDGRTALALLMEQHGLSQADLSDVATQSVISEILNGKRQLNIRHIKALSERFDVSADTFF